MNERLYDRIFHTLPSLGFSYLPSQSQGFRDGEKFGRPRGAMLMEELVTHSVARHHDLGGCA